MASVVVVLLVVVVCVGGGVRVGAQEIITISRPTLAHRISALVCHGFTITCALTPQRVDDNAAVPHPMPCVTFVQDVSRRDSVSLMCDGPCL